MRRNEKEIKDASILEEWLRTANICRIALHDDPFPYIVPMNYGYHNHAIYFHCAKSGRKIDLIRKNPKVAFEIEVQEKLITGETSCQWTTHFQSLMGTGEISFVDDLEERRKGLDILMSHHGKTDNAYPEKMLKRTMVLKLNIDSISGKHSGI